MATLPPQGRMTHTSLTSDVIEGFDLALDASSPPKLLAGGAGTTYHLELADVVLKPDHDLVETEIVCNILSQINPVDASWQAPKPLRSTAGSFVFQGWSATSYMHNVRPLVKAHGEYTLERFAELLSICQSFHIALRHVKITDADIKHLQQGRSHVWAHAHEAVWSRGTDPQTLLQPVAPGPATDREHPFVKLVSRLISLATYLGDAPVHNAKLYQSNSQIIHGDMVGGDNVLFPLQPGTLNLASPSPSLPAAVIDLSPTMAPASYALGILLADGLIWCGIGLEILDLAGRDFLTLDMLRRGLLFRCLSDIGLVEGGNESASLDVTEIERVTGMLEAMLEVEKH